MNTPTVEQKMPVLAQSLQQQVNALMRGPSVFRSTDPDDPGFKMASPNPEPHPDAPSALANVNKLIVRAMPKVVTDWCMALATGPNFPPQGDDLPLRIAAIRTACGDLPAIVWNKETLAEALRTFKVWPSAADVHAFLKPYADLILGTRDALEKIAKAARKKEAEKKPETREPVTDEVREAVRAVAEAFLAERSWNRSTETGEKPKKVVRSSLVDDAKLMMLYKKQFADGGPLAQIAAQRLAGLKVKIGKSYRQRIEDGDPV